MSYLLPRISILYATMQINNQSAVSGAFLIVCVCVCVWGACLLACFVYQHVFDKRDSDVSE